MPTFAIYKILFSCASQRSLLDVSLSSQFTDIKALARLRSKVSGHSEGNIRTCINSGIDYDKPSVK